MGDMNIYQELSDKSGCKLLSGETKHGAHIPANPYKRGCSHIFKCRHTVWYPTQKQNVFALLLMELCHDPTGAVTGA